MYKTFSFNKASVELEKNCDLVDSRKNYSNNNIKKNS